MGWNEILGESLDPSAIAQWWVRNKQGVLSHLRNGREFVMSKVGFVYFDYNYILTPLKKCYHYEPIPKELEPQYHKNVLGIEAPLWTEWVPNWDRLDWQTFPRLIAVAETGWTPKSRKDYDFFRERLPQILKRLKKYGVKSTELEDVDPPFLKRIFKLHTILQWPEVWISYKKINEFHISLADYLANMERGIYKVIVKFDQ